ncbi:MAG: glycosyl hydrolase family 38 [Muribaculaceae bacterium]|nr:glycosyl hydrolase family 38 [Muribaculaceae bacterium]
MKLRFTTIVGIILSVLSGVTPVTAGNLGNISGYVPPTVYRSDQGPQQRVDISFFNEGNSAEASVQLADMTLRTNLLPGNNTVSFMIPATDYPVDMPVSVTSAEEVLRGSVKVVPPRQWQVNMVQHTHTDIGYTRSQMEILAEHMRYIDFALDYCDATDNYPEDARFKWTCEVAWPVNEYIRNRPASQIERLKKRVNEGRIELAGMYLNFDELPDEQTLAASLAPLATFRANGLPCSLAMQDDVNGIGWCFAEYFADAGIRYLNMGTHGHRALICFDKPTVFRWLSPSGKEVIAYRGEHYHHGNHLGVEKDDFEGFEHRMLDYLQQLEAKDYPFDIISVQYSGYLTDNAPPATKSSDNIRRWNEKYVWPKIHTATASEFFKTVENKYSDKIDTIRGAWPDWWTDGFASGAREAAVSRATHSAIIANQNALAMCKLQGAALPGDINRRINEVNDALLFYDEHTFGHSESVRNPYGLETWEQRSLKQSYAWEAYRHASLLGEVALGIMQDFVPRAKEPAIAVFNPLNFPYTGTARIYIDHQMLPLDKHFEIIDYMGNIVPAQPGETRSDGTYWTLYLTDVPPMGQSRYIIRVDDRMPATLEENRNPELDSREVSNRWYDIKFNPSRGTISSLRDRDLDKELLTPDAGWQFGEFIHETIDSRHHLEQYHAPQSTRMTPENMRFEGYQPGAVWDTYSFVAETPAGIGPDNLRIQYRIYNTEKKIEAVYRLRKKDNTDPESIYISFPLEVEDGKLMLDVPGGVIEAGVDQIPGSSNDWYTVQNFVAARNDSMQVIVVSPEIPLMHLGAINLGRYKAGALPQSTNIYSWPMNNYWTTNFNADQMGEMEWTYQISSSDNPSTEYAITKATSERISPLCRVLPAAMHNTADSYPSQSLLDIDPSNILLIKMTPLEGENALLLQLREIAGETADFDISSPVADIHDIMECDVTGRPLIDGSLQFNPWETKFIKVSI